VTRDRPVPPKDRGGRDGSRDPAERPGGIQVRARHGVWEVTVDGRFYGDYHQEEHALAAAAEVERTMR
jgi:hypothetical protein